MLPEPSVVLEGLTLPECPRWHDGALYFVDILEGRIFRHNLLEYSPAEPPELVVSLFPNHAGGLGFLPSGEMLAVIQDARAITRIKDGIPLPYADLIPVTRFRANDMIVHGDIAYVSQPGFDVFGGPPAVPVATTELLMVRTGGTVEVAASGLHSPNGLAVSPDGARLFVAETRAQRISVFTIGKDGKLSDYCVFAEVPGGGYPDGICLDEEGGVWAAVPVALGNPGRQGPGVVRLTPEDGVTHVVPIATNRRALACAFGGPDRSDLFVCTVEAVDGVNAFAPGRGRIERLRTGFRGAGKP